MNEATNETEILKDLVLSEVATLQKLKELVEISKRYFNIEDQSGKIILNPSYNFTNYEKIQLTLIGKYFAMKLKITNSPGATIGQLSDELGIVKTTLSAPLGSLVKSGDVMKDVGSIYKIAYHKIEYILKNIDSQYKERD